LRASLRVSTWLLIGLLIAESIALIGLMSQLLEQFPPEATKQRAFPRPSPLSLEQQNQRERLEMVSAVVVRLAGVSVLVAIGEAVLLVAWFCCMYRNLQSLESPPQRPLPIWIALLFVPVVNVLSLYLMFLELWSASDPGRLNGVADKPSSAFLVLFWWLIGCAAACWLIFVALTPFDLRDVIDQFYLAQNSLAICCILTIEQMVWLVIVGKLSAMQERRNYLANDSFGRTKRQFHA
jgi:hypothetical protein